MVARFAASDKRIDDLRADMNLRFADLNQTFGSRLDGMNQTVGSRLDDLNQTVNNRLNDLNQKLTTFMWIVSAWFTFLTAVLAVFGFLRR